MLQSNKERLILKPDYSSVAKPTYHIAGVRLGLDAVGTSGTFETSNVAAFGCESSQELVPVDAVFVHEQSEQVNSFLIQGRRIFRASKIDSSHSLANDFADFTSNTELVLNGAKLVKIQGIGLFPNNLDKVSVNVKRVFMVHEHEVKYDCDDSSEVIIIMNSNTQWFRKVVTIFIHMEWELQNYPITGNGKDGFPKQLHNDAD